MEGCSGNINVFCYVCGEFTPVDAYNKQSKKKGRAFSADLKRAYELYYNQSVIENVDWVPKSVCITCYSGLMKWLNRNQIEMRYGIPMIWIDPGVHNPANCYACVNYFHGMNTKNTKSKVYHSVQSAQRPLPRPPGVSPPLAPTPDRRTTTTATTATTNATETPDYEQYIPEEGPSTHL